MGWGSGSAPRPLRAAVDAGGLAPDGEADGHLGSVTGRLPAADPGTGVSADGDPGEVVGRLTDVVDNYRVDTDARALSPKQA